jgi:hypothetical protein
MELVLKDKAIFMPGAIETLGEAEAERLWGMLETFGQYGFNKSHAVCYALIGYVCAFLKHHFPLQWWCSVLRNADRNEIDQQFWTHCGHLVLKPDVKLSQEDFAIEGECIRAPLRLLNGVGEKAHAELVEGRPYTDVHDFCRKVYDRKVRTGSTTTVMKEKKRKVPKKLQKPGEPTEIVEKVEVKKLKLGRSALNNTILTKLIISGTADALFPPDLDTYGKLLMFSEAWAEAHGLRKKDGTLKLKSIDNRFLKVTPLQHFLLTKSILPSYSDDLATLLYQQGRKDLTKPESDKTMVWRMPKTFAGNDYAPVLSAHTARNIMDCVGHGISSKFKFAVIGYVSKAESFWNGKASRIAFEVEGERFGAVAWPKRDDDGNKEPMKLPDDLVGSVAIIALSRWSIDKQFSIDDIVQAEPPFSLKVSEEESAEESAE